MHGDKLEVDIILQLEFAGAICSLCPTGHHEFHDTFRVVYVELRDGDTKRPVAYERDIGRIVQRKRVFTGDTVAKYFDLILRALFESLIQRDINIPGKLFKFLKGRHMLDLLQ